MTNEQLLTIIVSLAGLLKGLREAITRPPPERILLSARLSPVVGPTFPASE
ncbi:MAG: hypothetical protein OXH92_02235 [Bryobacterales bacterium]|nr:hypothetical protein [Bryobacterales bacterium]MDE0432805.1 hypothetical protein [Bryobacterales bacterium]